MQPNGQIGHGRDFLRYTFRDGKRLFKLYCMSAARRLPNAKDIQIHGAARTACLAASETARHAGSDCFMQTERGA